MSVYIKGMEMPNNCINCAARHGAECWLADCSYIPNIRKERPKWCPLVPVPPHGRLGDLDKLAIEIMDAKNADQALAMIDDAPTIIPADPAEEG